MIRRTIVALASASSLLAVSAIWTAGPAGADTYRKELVNHVSGLRTDVIWGSTADYQGVFLYGNNASASQEFDLLTEGSTSGYFRIRARHSNQCLMLDWRGGTYNNGTAVIQYPYCAAGYGPSEWSTRWLSGTRCSGNVCTTGVDHMVLVNRHTNRCLDTRNPAGGSPPWYAVLQQWDCVGSTSAWNIGNQSWDILAPGTVRID